MRAPNPAASTTVTAPNQALRSGLAVAVKPQFAGCLHSRTRFDRHTRRPSRPRSRGLSNSASSLASRCRCGQKTYIPQFNSATNDWSEKSRPSLTNSGPLRYRRLIELKFDNIFVFSSQILCFYSRHRGYSRAIWGQAFSPFCFLWGRTVLSALFTFDSDTDCNV